MSRKLFFPVFSVILTFSQPTFSSSKQFEGQDFPSIPNSTIPAKMSMSSGTMPLNLSDLSISSTMKAAEQYLEGESFFKVASVSAMSALKKYYKEAGLQQALADLTLKEDLLGFVNFSKELADLPEFFNYDFGIAAYEWRQIIVDHLEKVHTPEKVAALLTALFPNKKPLEVTSMLGEPVDFVEWMCAGYSKEKLLKNLDDFMASSEMLQKLTQKGYQVSVENIKANPSILEELGSKTAGPSLLALPKASVLETVAKGVGKAILYTGAEKLMSYGLKGLGIKESCSNLVSHVAVSLPALANPYLAAADLSLYAYFNREEIKDCAVSTYEVASDWASRAYKVSAEGIQGAVAWGGEVVGGAYTVVKDTAKGAYEANANQLQNLKDITTSFTASTSEYLYKQAVQVGENIKKITTEAAALYPKYFSLNGRASSPAHIKKMI